MATERAIVAAQAADGKIVEAIEWAAGGVEKAHSNPAVLKLWEWYAACEIVPLNQVAELSTMFASFPPIGYELKSALRSREESPLTRHRGACDGSPLN